AELKLDEKVNVKNLCNWDLYFYRIESVGEIKVPPNGFVRLTRHEIQSQVFNGNKFFVGIDGNGAHPKLYIDDKATRILVGFETE
ncbi:hypothetical protein M3691_38165, partial [Paenibacillus elgii]|nr:hypothetical protein [Paenibacillus elgii]